MSETFKVCTLVVKVSEHVRNRCFQQTTSVAW